MQGNTLGFYNSNAIDYAADGDTPNPKLFGFLKRCKPGGRILELGTGSGTDASAILNAGFQLDATDGSSELAAIAAKRLGQPVRTICAENRTWSYHKTHSQCLGERRDRVGQLQDRHG